MNFEEAGALPLLNDLKLSEISALKTPAQNAIKHLASHGGMKFQDDLTKLCRNQWELIYREWYK